MIKGLKYLLLLAGIFFIWRYYFADADKFAHDGLTHPPFERESNTISAREIFDFAADKITQISSLKQGFENNFEPDGIRDDVNQVRMWIKKEASALDLPQVDVKQKQQQIAKVLNSLTKAQAQELLAIAKDPAAAAGEKILSTYLLVESGLKGVSFLSDFIKSPPHDFGTPSPHSENEFKGVREKSLRIMAIDGLVAKAEQFPEALQSLRAVIEDIADPYLRAYAQSKLKELNKK